MNYFIKEGYKENINQAGEVTKQYTAPPLDTIWQIEVYKHLAHLIKENNLSRIIEFGCGSGYKLMKYIAPISPNVTGLDFEHAIKYCREKYPGGNWISLDFDKADLDLEKPYDLLMAVDVIEHLVYPEKMIKQMKECAGKDSLLVFSTPERDLIRGTDTFGPPDNLKHVRKWNQQEFKYFLESQGLVVIDHPLMKAKKYTLREYQYHLRKRKPLKTCQVAVCKLK